jgi:ribosomal protein S18 acetylase RimI-like enzyme
MSDIIIRAATLADLDTLRIFEQGVVDAERPFDPTLGDGPLKYYDLEFLILSTEAALLVAEADGLLVACGYSRIATAKPYLRHRMYGYLGFMYTLEAYRGKGINRMIIEGLTAWSQARGITELRLDVYHDNESAIKAYEKVGFLKHMIEMRKKV